MQTFNVMLGSHFTKIICSVLFYRAAISCVYTHTHVCKMFSSLFNISRKSVFPYPVHRAAGCIAPCCSPAYTVTVGHRCGAAETGASVPDQGKQSEHTAHNSQPAGLIFKNVCYSSTLKRNILDSPNRFKVSFAVLTKCALNFLWIRQRFNTPFCCFALLPCRSCFPL